MLKRPDQFCHFAECQGAYLQKVSLMCSDIERFEDWWDVAAVANVDSA